MTVRMRSTSGKGGSRRSHNKIANSPQKEEGGIMRLRHRASRITGLYKGSVVEVIAKKNKKNIEKNLAKKNIQQEKSDVESEKKTLEQAEIPKI